MEMELEYNKEVMLLPGEGLSLQTDKGSIFINIGAEISDYKDLRSEFHSKEGFIVGGSYKGADYYDFYDYGITAWVDENTGDRYIDTMECAKSCL